MISRSWCSSAILLAAIALLSGDVHASKIDADPNKKYALTSNRGPWMIMVATFQSTGADGEVDEGKSPQQAAEELVLELRQLGLPAYFHEHESEAESVKVNDRFGRERSKKQLHRSKSVYVIAGNYSDLNDKTAQDSLAWVKKLRPRCLQEGVEYRPTPGRPGPLSGAFLTINPLRDPNETIQAPVDSLLVRLNNGEQYSLTENKGKYTLLVARFAGKSQTVKPGGDIPAIGQFLKTVSLDDAAISARELVTVLRGSYDKEETQFNNIEAYIWHDRHESVVTVGSFDSLNDPRLAKYKQMFGPRMTDLGNGATTVQPAHLGVGEFGRKRNETRLWVFDPDPQPYPVPRLR